MAAPRQRFSPRAPTHAPPLGAAYPPGTGGAYPPGSRGAYPPGTGGAYPPGTRGADRPGTGTAYRRGAGRPTIRPGVVGGPAELVVRPRAPRRARRAPGRVAAAALLLFGLVAVLAGVVEVADGFRLPQLLRGSDKPPPRAFPVLEPSEPYRLVIPALKIRARVHGVGLAEDGSIAVPPLQRHNEAGWFEQGPSPGQFGPAVIVGHADTRTGPSVFHDLDRLRPGERVEVVRRDLRVAVFEVNSVERFGKSALPVDRVYGDFSRPVLRLITCGGRWLGGRTGYADNIVVFASLVDTRRA